MTATLDKDYRLAIPEELRGEAGLEVGTPFQFSRLGQGFFVVPFTDSKKLKAQEIKSDLLKLQKAFEGEAERVGWKTEKDVELYCKEIRRELWKERYERHA